MLTFTVFNNEPDVRPFSAGQMIFEQGQPGEEDSAAAQQVAKPACQKQQSAKGDQVAVHYPGERGLREMQIVLYGGQRHVDHGGIEREHQLANTEDHHGNPGLSASARTRT